MTTLATVPSVPRTRVDEAGGLTVGDVIHKRFSTLPASATIGEVSEWFAASTSRRMAILAEEGRYAGSLTPADLSGALDLTRPAAEVANDGPTIAPDAPARVGEELALLTEARRVPVVDHDGRLLGIVSVTGDLTSFCGTD
jgi:CBS-domain-containing membrane protein